MRKPTPLKLAIIASGQRQKDIAERLGMDTADLSRIVNGLHADDAKRQAIVRELRTTLPDITLDALWPEAQAA